MLEPAPWLLAGASFLFLSQLRSRLDGISRELNVTNYFRQLVSVETKSFTEAPVFAAIHSALSCYLDSLHVGQQVLHLAAG